MHELAPEDIKAIARLHQMWIAAELAGNTAEVLHFCTDEALWIPPDGPVLEGHAALGLLQEPAIEVQDINIKNLKIRGSGNVAYLTGSYATKYTVSGQSGLRTARGTQLWILHKVPPWKVAIISWSALAEKAATSA